MRIVYTHEALSEPVSRTSRYYYELVRRIQRKVESVCICKLISTNKYFRKIKFGIPVFVKPSLLGLDEVVEKIEELNTRINLKLRSYDVVHITDDRSEVLKLTDKPVVITIHDVIAEKFNVYKKNPLCAHRYELINNATKIICSSEITRNDLLVLYDKVQPENVFVVYPGYCKHTSRYENKYNFDYLLYVGSRHRQYKNFDRFLRATAPVLQQNNVKLICTGQAFDREELRFIRSLDLQDLVVNVGFVKEDFLANLYHFAKMLVVPSKYEGYCSQILEAFENECPVCLSDIPYFHELAAEAAAFFDPNSELAIRNCIEYILTTPNFAADLVSRGSERKLHFTWDAAVDQAYDVYQKAMEVKKRIRY